MLSLFDLFSWLAVIVSIFAIYRACRARSILWSVAGAMPAAVLIMVAMLTHVDLDKRFGFGCAYACVLAALLCLMTACKCVWLTTRGVIGVPDGKPNDPDNILSAFPIVGPLPVHPAGTPWDGPLVRRSRANGVVGPKDLFPWSSDPPAPKTGEWTEKRNGNTIRMRWAPTTYCETLGRRGLRYTGWIINRLLK